MSNKIEADRNQNSNQYDRLLAILLAASAALLVYYPLAWTALMLVLLVVSIVIGSNM